MPELPADPDELIDDPIEDEDDFDPVFDDYEEEEDDTPF